jgi:hypothetical protein
MDLGQCRLDRTAVILYLNQLGIGDLIALCEYARAKQEQRARHDEAGQS